MHIADINLLNNASIISLKYLCKKQKKLLLLNKNDHLRSIQSVIKYVTYPFVRSLQFT